jgi:ankyrin repeat protein
MFGSGAIHAAYLGGHTAIVDLLLNRGVAIDPWLMAELGRNDNLARVVDADPRLISSFRPDRGDSLLHAAAYWGNAGGVKLLLRRGADPNAVTRDAFLGIPVLGSALATPDVPNPSDDEQVCLQLANLLLDAGADVNGQRRDGLTALHTAAYRGHVLVIRRLLQAGANPSIRGAAGEGNHAGQTPLDVAIEREQEEAARVIHQAGGEYTEDA